MGFLTGGITSVVAVVVVFLLLVTIHEFGHFIVAKKAGVLVPRFAIGFGPPLYRFGKGETEYSIRLFPLGGYVQLAGEIPQDTYFKLGETIAVELNGSGEVERIGDVSDLPNGIAGPVRAVDMQRRYTITIETDQGVREFPIARRAWLLAGKDPLPLAPPDRQMGQKPLLARMLIVLAGPIMNVLLTIVLFMIIGGIIGTPANPPQLASVVPGTPAARAGLQPGDVVTQVNGKPVPTWMQFVYDIEGHPDRRMLLTVNHLGRTKTTLLIPEKDASGQGFIGVSAAMAHDLPTAIEGGFVQTGEYTQLIYNALGSLFTHKNAFVKDMAGPVKIVQVIGQQAQLGILQLMNLTAILSLNLAIFNLLPIPALDGSRFLFMVVEWLRGKPIDPRKEYLVHAIGFALLILLTVFRTYLDVTQLF